MAFNDEKSFNEILNHVKPLLKKIIGKREEKDEVFSWILSWMIKWKKFHYLFEKLNRNYETNKKYLPEEQRKDFNKLLFAIINSGESEYYKEQKYFRKKTIKNDYNYEDNSIPLKSLLVAYDNIYNPEKKVNVIPFSTPIGENSSFGNFFSDKFADKKETEKIDYEHEKQIVSLLLKKLPDIYRVVFKLSFLIDLLDSDDYKFIKQESGLSKREIEKKIIANYDASTRIRPLNSNCIAELLNTNQSVINQRVTRARAILKNIIINS